MSDCSTEAMKPKELHKKCGTCYWMMMQPGHGECGACGNPMCAQAHDPVAYANGFYEYTTVDGDCEGEFWKPRTNTIEQRYQQLEQIACEMFQDIESAFVRGKFKPEAYADYRDRLEAAGVETHGFKTEGEDD